MTVGTRFSVLLLFALLTACSSKRQAPAEPPAAAPPQEQPEAKAPNPRPPRVFDAKGRLIPSNEYVAGVRMPKGVELFRVDELTHVYQMRAPIDRVLAYFGPMMITGKVERQGKGAAYRRASVRGAEMNPTKVDLSISEVGSNLVLISLTELPPPPEYAPSESSTKAAARDTWRMLD